MTLTVPRAGVAAGRAPGIQVEADQTGAAVARFGERLADVGTRILNDQIDRQATRLQIDMTRELGQARLEFEQMNDPDAIDAGWQARSAELRKRFVEGDGTTPMHPRLRERVGLAFDELAGRHAVALGTRAVEARQNQRAAQLVEYTTVVASAASTADADTREALLQQYRQDLLRRVEANEITPLESTRLFIEQREKVFGAAARETLASDPQRFLELDADGYFNDLDPETRAGYRVQAQNTIEARAEAAVQEAERRQRERDAELDAQLGTVFSLAMKGQPTEGSAELLASPEAMRRPEWAKAYAAEWARTARPDFLRMTPADFDAWLAQEQARPKSATWEAEIYGVIEAMRDEAARGWQQDAKGFAATSGAFRVPALPDFDPTNPTPYAQALAQSWRFGTFLRDEGYTGQPPLMTAQERAAFEAAAAPERPPWDRVALASALVEATRSPSDPGQRVAFGAAVEGMIADPVFVHAVGLLDKGGQPGTLYEIFKGQQAIANGNVALPPAAERVDLATQQIEALFADEPNGERITASVREAADALYAARKRHTDPTADLDQTAYTQALHEVLGGTGNFGDERATGGVHVIKGRLTVLPTDISATQFNDALLALGEVGSRRSPEVDPAVFSRQLAAIANRAGSLPMLGASPLTVQDWRNPSLKLVAFGYDAYGLVLYSDAGPRAVKDAEGRDWTFSARALLRETRR